MRASLPFVAVLVFTLGFTPQSHAANKDAVPTAWLDSLSANLWRIKTDGVLSQFRIHSVNRMVKKDGEMKDENEQWQLVNIASDGTRTFHTTDAQGNILPDDKPKVVKPETTEDSDSLAHVKEDEDNNVNISVAPLDPVKLKYRSNHRFTLLPSPGNGLVKFAYEPIDKDKGGFDGEATIDTTTWLPVNVTGYPIPLPNKRIKQMDLSIDFEKWGKGYAFPAHVTSHVTAKWLLLTFRMVSTQDFVDFVAKDK